MNTSENKQLLQEIFAEMEQGNLKTFGENLAEDVKWTISGESDWSKTYAGIEAVRNDLLKPLFEKFADQYSSQAVRIIAEDDLVVVEAKGKVNTKSGKPYNNSYCFIFRLANGKIKEITEYCDTELIAKTLDDKYSALEQQKKQESVNAILKLYDLRREEKMRAARAWFFSEFSPKNVMDIIALYRDGEQASAHFRTVVSYWDMAASLVLNGAIDEKLFLDANTEHIFVYAKIKPVLNEIRELFGEPDFLLNFETLVLRIPDIEAKIENRKRLFKLWTKNEANVATQ